MIVVVEGPSAAGKTAWCRRHADEHLVAEQRPAGTEPDRGADALAAAGFWVWANAERWARALAIEADTGLAVCDTDPFKLHYSWSLHHIGELSEADFRAEAEVTRRAFARDRLGLADAFLVSLPSPAVLRQRRDTDATRRRRNFERHVRLGPALRHWYETIDRLEPGRVWWRFPRDGLSAVALPPPRRDRSDVDWFDRLLGDLPSSR